MPNADSQVLKDPLRLETLRRFCLLERAADPAFDRLARLAARICRAPIALVTFIDEDRQVFKSHVGLPEQVAAQGETPISHSFCQHVVASAAPLIIDNAREHALVCDNLAIDEMGVEAYLGMPITLSSGVTLGSFCVIDHQPRVWTEEDIDMLRDLSASVIAEVELRVEIIERAEAEKRNIQLTLEREQGRILAEFVTHTSHDLRTPLAIMTSSLDLYDRIKDPQKQQRYIHSVRHQINHLNGLIDEIHAFIRLQAPDETPFETVDIQQLVQMVCADYEFPAQQRHIRFFTDLDAGMTFLSANPLQLRQAMTAVLDNAFNHTPSQGSVTVRLRRADRQVIIEVQDTGSGIPAEALPHIFEPFFKGDKSRSMNGSGLGLTMCKRFVEMHGGSIEVESTPDAGSTFRIILPT